MFVYFYTTLSIGGLLEKLEPIFYRYFDWGSILEIEADFKLIIDFK